MEDRLVALLKSEGINPTRFAERIGVQRSSMSHILSGRNKPSYDFIVKILESFPAVSPDWLLRGKGSMYKDDYPPQPGLFDEVKSGTENKADEPVHVSVKTESVKPSDHAESPVRSASIKSGKDVERVIIFYTDKTFIDFRPGS
ncbi:MAG: helix-turn-helix domain-containing protein [Bacteroidales bacterium]|nr:helix-turn-helix domain-containing protein [Bacteroidales bacterium]